MRRNRHTEPRELGDRGLCICLATQPGEKGGLVKQIKGVKA